MKYPTIYTVLTAQLGLGREIDASEGHLVKGAPEGISRSLKTLLEEMDLEWLHDKSGVYFLVNSEDEPVLGYDSETKETEKFHAFQDELIGKESHKLLNQIIKSLAKPEDEK